MKMLRWSLPLLVLFAAISTASATAVVDNDEIYIWGDDFGDQFDNYIEAAPGDTVELSIYVNDLNGSYDMLYESTLVNNNWTHAANGARTGIWWDPVVIEGASVYEDKHVGEDPTTYYGSYWGSTGYNNHLAHYWTKHYDNWNAVRWVAEGRWVIDMVMTIREDAPLGITTIGMEQGFFWSNNMFDEYQGYFFWDRIESTDPYAMRINVVGGAPGDFDGDGDVDADDVDDLCANMAGDVATYDMDGDGDVDEDDMTFHVENYLEYDTDDDDIVDGVGTFRGDFNADGAVNGTDLSIMSGNFGGAAGYAGGNANCDLTVNGTDLSILSGSFGSVVTAAVPEPMTMGLLSLGGLALLKRRK